MNWNILHIAKDGDYLTIRTMYTRISFNLNAPDHLYNAVVDNHGIIKILEEKGWERKTMDGQHFYGTKDNQKIYDLINTVFDENDKWKIMKTLFNQH